MCVYVAVVFVFLRCPSAAPPCPLFLGIGATENARQAGERQAVTLSTQKRCSIKSLPNHLAIHLKRFDFDFDTMQQTKVCGADSPNGPRESSGALGLAKSVVVGVAILLFVLCTAARGGLFYSKYVLLVVPTFDGSYLFMREAWRGREGQTFPPRVLLRARKKWWRRLNTVWGVCSETSCS